jgi:RNA polymerase sigma-70 factor (ECF subfamily)
VPQAETVSAESLVRSHFRRVWNFCRGMLRNDADVEDACQEVFLTVTRRGEELAQVRNPAPWVMKIALLTCLYLRRKRGRAVPLEDDAVEAAGPPLEPDADVSRLRDALDRIPDRYQAVLALHFQQGMPHEEMAEVLGVSRGTLRVLLHRAIARLREEARKP